MPTTAQLARRTEHIGASEVGALLGLDPFKNKFDLWLHKTGKLEPEAESENDPKAAGRLLEPAVLQFAENRLGKLTRNQARSAKRLGIPLVAHCDAILNATGQPIEAKTSGLYGFTTDVWGAEETDEAPDRVILQAQAQILCANSDLCFVPAFIAFRGFVMFRVPKDPELIDIIGNEVNEFWEKCVLTDTPPDNLVPHIGVVKRMSRQAEKTVPIEQSLVDTWQEKSAAASAAKKEQETALAAILAALGDAEAGQCETGTFNYLLQERAEYTVKATSFRVGRFKKNK